MPSKQISALGDDLVGILHHLEFLVAIMAVQAHATAHDLQQIEDFERPVALMRAELAMFGMIDSHERIDASLARGLKLVELELPLEFGQDAETETLQPHGRLAKIDERDARNLAQNLLGRLHHAGNAGM